MIDADGTTADPSAQRWVGTASAMLRTTLPLVVGLVALGSAGAALLGDGEGQSAGLATGGMLLVVMVGVWWVFDSVTVQVQPTEVVVAYGRSPLRTRIRLDQIREVDTFDLRGWKWGWGYRGSRRLLRRAAIVVRSGDALRLHLSDGSSLAITVDDAAGAAAAIRLAMGGG